MNTTLTASRQEITTAVNSMSYSELLQALRKLGTVDEELNRRPIWVLRRKLCLVLFHLRRKALRKQRQQVTVNIEGTDVPVIGEFHGCPVVDTEHVTSSSDADDIYSMYHPHNKRQDKIASITILVNKYLMRRIKY